MNRIALTRAVSPTLAQCALTYVAREPLDVARAQAQHAHYERCLEKLGCTGCLHLKSAVTRVGPETLLGNRDWVAPTTFTGMAWVDVAPGEAHAGNALLVGETVVYPHTYPQTRARLEARGIAVRTVDVRELAKAEGAVTCCSLIFSWM